MRRGRVERGYLSADVEDLNRSTPGRSSTVRPCPFVSRGKNNEGATKDHTYNLVENGTIFVGKRLPQRPV